MMNVTVTSLPSAGLDLSRFKRTVRRSPTGNLIGYLGGKRWEIINGCGIDPFTEAEDKAAAAWVQGREDWREAAWQ
jgi:hypothetical protein